MQYREHVYAEGEWDLFFYKKNLFGDIEAVYSADGTLLVSYTYDAYGWINTVYSNGGASTGARYNPFTYRGYYYDTDLSLSHQSSPHCG